MAQKADASEATPSSPTSPESELNCWILSVHEKYEYTIPQFPVLHVKLVKVKYLIVEDDQQYRYCRYGIGHPAVSIPNESVTEGWIHVACKHCIAMPQ